MSSFDTLVVLVMSNAPVKGSSEDERANDSAKNLYGNVFWMWIIDCNHKITVKENLFYDTQSSKRWVDFSGLRLHVQISNIVLSWLWSNLIRAPPALSSSCKKCTCPILTCETDPEQRCLWDVSCPLFLRAAFIAVLWLLLSTVQFLQSIDAVCSTFITLRWLFKLKRKSSTSASAASSSQQDKHDLQDDQNESRYPKQDPHPPVDRRGFFWARCCKRKTFSWNVITFCPFINWSECV